MIQSLADEEHAGEVENYVYLNKSESDKVKREKTDQELALQVWDVKHRDNKQHTLIRY